MTAIIDKIGAAGPLRQTIEFKIDQGFVATVVSDLKHYRVLLRCGAWTYEPVISEIVLTATRLGGKTPEETKRLLAYAIKTQALRELSAAVMSGGEYDAHKPKTGAQA